LEGNAPIELPVQASLPLDLKTETEFSLAANDPQGFRLEASLSPACPINLSRSYTWEGEGFVPADGDLTIDPQPDLVQYCAPILTHALSAWKPAQILPLVEGLLPSWPPALDLDELPYPTDALDELRYRLGITQALAGQFEAASLTLQAVAENPVVPESRWGAPASQFLQAFSSPQTLYTACQGDEACDLRSALETLTAASRDDDPARAQESLRLKGVPIRASGIFDFDQDGQVERWITVQPRPGQQLEFWILAASPAGVQALYVDVTLKDLPEPFYDEPVTELPPVFQITAGVGFQLIRLPESSAIFIQPAAVKSPLTTYTRDALLETQDVLLSGGDPAQARDSLLEVLESNKFNCLNDRICDRFYYTLGLAYELAGDRRKAIDTYIQLWWENRNSPFTKIARMKIGVITPTPSATNFGAKTPTPGTPGAPTQAPTAMEATPYP
jgi:tetratricopeptide (TPR) repeat protein